MFPSSSRAKRSFCDAQIWMNFASVWLEVASRESSSRYSLTFIDALCARSWAAISSPVIRFDPARPALRAKLIEAPTGESERSEEHTSELQSLRTISYAVFCLKKKK